MTVLAPRDFLAEVIAYLDTRLGAPVSPDAPAGRGLRVDVIAVTRANRVTDVALVALQGYSTDRAEAHDLTATAWALLLAAHDDAASTWRSVNPQGGPVPFPDDDRPGRHRFQATALVSARGT